MSLRLLVRDSPARSIALAIDDNQAYLLLRQATHSQRGEHSNGHEAPAGNKSRCMVEFLHEQLPRNFSEYRSVESGFLGTLGLINIREDIFLCLIRESVRVATVRPGETVQQIKSVDFYCLNRSHFDSDRVTEARHWDDFGDETGSENARYGDDLALEHPCYELKRMLGDGTFYYSNDFDITNKLQDRLSDQSTFDIESLDDEYLWSQYLIKPLLSFRSRLAQPVKRALDKCRILTLATRGFVSTITIPSSSVQPRTGFKLPASLTLISRLSCRRAGTRFNSRGIDDEGNVANFVESETVLWLAHGLCFSYVQTRGSVPLFWEQAPGLLPGQQKIQITRSPEATQPAFDRHFERLETVYGVVSILNLLSESRLGEAELTMRFRYHVHHSPLNQLMEMDTSSGTRLNDRQFDFHAESKAGGSAVTTAIRGIIHESALLFAYFVGAPDADARSTDKPDAALTIIARQTGVFRTNCLDCLDRTNLVQTIISQEALESFFHRYSGNPSPDFWTRHSTLWADNGDALSFIYAGTGALKSSFTRHGKKNLAGVLADARKSATRLYVNNFVDKGRQNTIDMLLGRLVEQSPVNVYDPVTDYVNTELRRRAGEYTSCEEIHIWAGTFNLNGKSTATQQDLGHWLRPQTLDSPNSPEVYMVGFQEIVELSPQQIMSTDPDRRREWEHAVLSALNLKTQDEYVLLRSGQLVGAALLIFVKRRVLHRIKNVEGAERKLGMSGVAGNKGAVAIRLEYGNTQLCFVTAHLAAGFAAIDQRNRDFKTISRGLRFRQNRSIEDHDAIIWAGDFNYRIGLGDEKVRHLVEIGDLERLYQNDQLSLQMIAGRVWPYYSEAQITFNPTYKYENGTDDYDRSEKGRIPAWCDRILRRGEILQQLEYSTAPLYFSDHRPVYARFRCTIQVVDHALKQKLDEEVYLQRRQDIGDAVVEGEVGASGDEDLIGYEAIAPELPPASSDRYKWWLDDQLPVRSIVAPPNEHITLNRQRPSNPFRASPECMWTEEASRSRTSGMVTVSNDPRVGERDNRRQHQVLAVNSSQEPRQVHGQQGLCARPATDFNPRPSPTSVKPSIPRKPYRLINSSVTPSRGGVSATASRSSSSLSPAQARAYGDRAERVSNASNPRPLQQALETIDGPAPKELQHISSLIDDDPEAGAPVIGTPALRPSQQKTTR